MTGIKQLQKADIACTKFKQEMLNGESLRSINIDQVQLYKKQTYLVFEFINCVTYDPYLSTPNNFWAEARLKYTALWNITNILGGKLYIVNYAEEGTAFYDHVLLIRVLSIDPDDGIKDVKRKFTREEFSKWFIETERNSG
jgi:hypothetical protein